MTYNDNEVVDEFALQEGKNHCYHMFVTQQWLLGSGRIVEGGLDRFLHINHYYCACIILGPTILPGLCWFFLSAFIQWHLPSAYCCCKYYNLSFCHV